MAKKDFELTWKEIPVGVIVHGVHQQCDRCIRRILCGVVSWKDRLSRVPPKRQGVQRWRSHAMW